MKNALVISLLLSTVLVLPSCNGTKSASPAADAPKGLSNAQFEHALRNISTAPNYILITVIDNNAGKQEAVCIEAQNLLSAISVEKKLKWKEAMALSLKQENGAFHFSNAAALKLVSRAYTEAVLAEARDFLADMTIDEIEAATGSQDSKFYEFCARKPGAFAARFPAIAHVLTERGILCVRGCKPGLFHIDRRTHNKELKATRPSRAP
jgi:hypothetical protein